MLEWLKSKWAKWKVQISLVGGALVIATAYGQCTLEPNVEAIEDAVEEEAADVSGEESSSNHGEDATTTTETSDETTTTETSDETTTTETTD